LAGTPAAFLVSFVGLFAGSGRRPAIAGLIISGLAGLLFFILPILAIIFCAMR